MKSAYLVLIIFMLISINAKAGILKPLLDVETKKIEIRRTKKNIKDPIEEKIIIRNVSNKKIFFKLLFQESIYKKNGRVNAKAMSNLKSKGNVPSLLPYIKYKDIDYMIDPKGKIEIPFQIVNAEKMVGTHFVHFYPKKIERRDNYILMSEEEKKKSAFNEFQLEFKGSITFTNIDTGDYKMDIQTYYVKENRRVYFVLKNIGTNVITNINILPFILNEKEKIKEKIAITNLSEVILNPNMMKIYKTNFIETNLNEKSSLRLIILSELDNINTNLVIKDIKVVEKIKQLEKMIDLNGL